MHQEPNCPLSATANRAPADSDTLHDSQRILRELDRMLVQRASAIESELREISQVRKRIEGMLAPVANGAGRGAPPGSGGASLGQMI